MKILEKNGKYEKVSNDFIADDKVKKLGWRYATREEWKKNVRDVKKPEPVKVEDGVLSKHEQTKKRRAEKHSKLKAKQI